MAEEFNPFEFRETTPSDYSSRVEREVVYVSEPEQESEEQELPLTEEEIAEIEAEERRQERQRRREANPLWQFISGNWLVNEGVAESYRYLIAVAVLLFCSVVSIFTSLRLDQNYARAVDNVQLLRERSLEYRTMRFDQTSHSAIVNELKKRGIPLYESKEAKIIIDK